MTPQQAHACVDIATAEANLSANHVRCVARRGPWLITMTTTNLEVRWLCYSHHHETHGRIKGTTQRRKVPENYNPERIVLHRQPGPRIKLMIFLANMEKIVILTTRPESSSSKQPVKNLTLSAKNGQRWLATVEIIEEEQRKLFITASTRFNIQSFNSEHFCKGNIKW